MTQLRALLQHGDIPVDARVVSIDAQEGLSTLFDVAVEFLSEDPDLDLAPLLWSSGSVRIEPDDGDAPVVWHGRIEECAYARTVGDRHAYRLRLRPLLHGLAYRVRSRTFQDQDAPSIVRKVLADAGVPAEATVWQLGGSYAKRSFCLQYKESELAFILRLLEDEGIFYWFEHEDERHTLHFGDGPAAHRPIDGSPELPASDRLHLAQTAIADLVLETSVVTDTCTLRDWNFEQPRNPIEARFALEGGGFELAAYPGRGMNPQDGVRRARNRLDAAQVERAVLHGLTNARTVMPGRRFTLTGALPPALDADYLVVKTLRAFRDPMATTGAADPRPFTATVQAIAADQEFRPPALTPWPRVGGKELAVVTGPAGEEIHVDHFGRIKVHFYWDREGKVDDTASFWIRVQQQNTSGSMILPRVGWEVEVGFLDGDPDRPVVLQRLYNRETMPPYGLPDNKTQSSLQSSSSPGGGGTNEVRMQDSNAGMEFFVHAAKDFALKAGHDMSEKIALDVHEEVGLALKSSVGGNEKSRVGANQSVNVTGNLTEETTGAKSITVGAADDWGITGAFTLTCDGDRSDDVGGMMNVLANRVTETFNGNLSRTVGAALCINAAGSIVEAVGGSKTELVGAAKIELIRQAKSEQVKGAKTLTSGALVVRTGKDLSVNAEAALAITVAGPIVERIEGDFTLGAEAVAITAPGGAELKVGGTTFTARGAALKVNAGAMGAKGGPMLQLKGKINYK